MVSGNARNISLRRSSRVSCMYVHLYPRSSNYQVLTFHLSIVPLALHPILQPLPRPRQTIHPSPLHTHLPIQKVLDIHLHHDGLPHHCGTVDGVQWISLLHSRLRLLENGPGPETLSARRTGMVCQCGYADHYRRGYFGITYAFAVEVAFAPAAEGGDYAGFWCRYLVSLSFSR